jgi:hypothetical protein
MGLAAEITTCENRLSTTLEFTCFRPISTTSVGIGIISTTNIGISITSTSSIVTILQYYENVSHKRVMNILSMSLAAEITPWKDGLAASLKFTGLRPASGVGIGIGIHTSTGIRTEIVAISKSMVRW